MRSYPLLYHPAIFALPALLAFEHGSNREQRTLDGPLVPLSNYILVEVDSARDTTSGGIVLSSKEKSKSGKIVAVGPGKDDKETGVTMTMPVKEGEHVLWGRYDGTELKYCGKDHTLLRENDICLVWDDESTSPTTDTARVIRGNVLLKVLRKPGETASGLFLAATDKDIPVEGEVIAKGGGDLTRDGTPVPIEVEIGDCVKYRDFDTTEISIEDEDYVVIRASNIICKWQKLEV